MESGRALLRTRDDGATELRVNGVFVMDDHETGSERLLARRALAAAGHPSRVLVGGLGLGFTVRELLADPRVEGVDVIEIEPAIVSWMRDGTLPGAEWLAPDGQLCIWSQGDSPAVRGALGEAFADVDGERVPVRLQDRDESYWLPVASCQYLREG